MPSLQEKPRNRGGKTLHRRANTRRGVLITGAASGFGTSLAIAFAHAGYDLVVHARSDAALAPLRRTLARAGHARCAAVVADIRSAEGLEILKTALAEQGVDVLINNAGVNPEVRGRIVTSSTADIQDVIQTNLSAVIALCASASEYFAKSGGGVIININSVAGLKGSTREAVYAASKFGLRGFSESVKDEWLKRGVRVTDIYPGGIATGMSSHRADVASLIDPLQLAEFVVGLCSTKTFFVREVSVQKTGNHA